MRDDGSAPGGGALCTAAADVPACILVLPFWAVVALLGAMDAKEEEEVEAMSSGGEGDVGSLCGGVMGEMMGADRAPRLY